MRKIALLLCCCLLGMAPAFSAAEDGGSTGSLPGIVYAGLNAYRNGGPQAAIQAWVKSGPLDGSAEASSDIGALAQLQEAYGAYRSFDIIHSYNLTGRILVIYLALNFEHGPVFSKFVVYRSEATWVVTELKFSPDDDAILPVVPEVPSK